MPETHDGLPVAGYHSQSGDNVALVNENKMIEERVLRKLDEMACIPDVDKRMLAIGRTSIATAFMWINRSVFKPGRASLPEDPTPE